MKLDDLQQAQELEQAKFLSAMETETNTWSCSAETISIFKFTLDYNTSQLWTRRREQWHTQINCVSVPCRDVLCVTLRRSSVYIPQPCEWGWGSPTAVDKDLDRESPGVRSGHPGKFWTCTVQHRVTSHNGVQHVCGSKARRTIQGHVPGELSVDSLSLCLPDFHVFFPVFKQKHFIVCQVFNIILS